ncbi:MAG: PA14 domain-containing protein [Planctomycetota bacterium]
MVCRKLPFWVIAAALCATVPAQSPPEGFAEVDFDIALGVLPGQLRFDRELLSVTPGSKVKLTLNNTDAMQHNFVLCVRGEGVAARVAAATLRLGAAASEKHYVPDSDEVLASTKAIFLDQSDTIWFRAPGEPGDYPFVCTLPGHSFTMKGVLRVGADAGPAAAPIENLRYRVFRGSWRALPDFDALTPFREGDLDGGLLDLGSLGERKNFGAVFTGTLEARGGGAHTFFLNSDDGSRVFVDGREVVSYDGVHGASEEQRGVVSLAAGPHQLRVEFFQGGGGQSLVLDVAGPDGERRKLWTKKQRPARVTPIAVHHHPVVMRVHVEGAAPRSVAVGMPGGMNCCFDAGQCCVQFGWAGAFLDVGPDRDGRGGRPCKTLGPRFSVGNLGWPLRVGSGAQPPARFVGYRTKPGPAFEVDWGGRLVTWEVAPAAEGVGLRYAFTFATPLDREATFAVDPDGVELASSLGAADGGRLPLPVGCEGFSVTVSSKGDVR